MTTADDYINRVIDTMPRVTPLRAQIALELHSNIAERLEHGQSIDNVLQQLGDPVTLAESYLAAVPLVSASFWRRAAAKIIDSASSGAAVVPLVGVLGAALIPEHDAWPEVLVIGIVAAALVLPVYTMAAEYWAGCTLGKWLLGLRVVRESGARISLGQSIVRQLPFVGQIFLIDVLFVLFTEKSQRAFELASKTRVVRAH
jgi:uncharacterized RDD family membrane protein YckC